MHKYVAGSAQRSSEPNKVTAFQNRFILIIPQPILNSVKMSSNGVPSTDENETRHCQSNWNITEPLASEADGPKPSFCIDRSTCSEWLAGLVGFGASVDVELYNLSRTSFTF